ncbi:MAG: flavodoxin-dependent (E)-4-hydroxy-3-methylbut-2-enyl-diphosphate synthase [Candidatus Omnitrophica bacterium]|nr:flavodoxin-dependent (E)-4-hydroxy-3-methylbut-2-enyl-diphosphate synthase [Candidatus Omnitrophota bacterium]
MIRRKKTRQIRIGKVKVGGSAPIAIQSMVKAGTCNVSKTVAQIKELEGAGCEIIRVAVKNSNDAAAVKEIKRKIKIPLVADIHFDYRLALQCIKSGADKIRVNPGNITKREEMVQIIKAAKKAKIPVRIGVNSGSVPSSFVVRRSSFENLASVLVKTAMKEIKLFEEMDFHDIIISLKASDVVSTVEAYRKMSVLLDYPLHLGVTASGPYDSGVVKSSIGIGALLLDGIGDTIRVSLTADPLEEVIAAKRILSALNIRRFGPDVISCPTCGRCQVDLAEIVKELECKLKTHNSKLQTKIAIMGCEVNGPGEAREADIGIAAGKGSGMLFKKGKIIKRIKEKDFVKELLKELENI